MREQGCASLPSLSPSLPPSSLQADRQSIAFITKEDLQDAAADPRAPLLPVSPQRQTALFRSSSNYCVSSCRDHEAGAGVSRRQLQVNYKKSYAKCLVPLEIVRPRQPTLCSA